MNIFFLPLLLAGLITPFSYPSTFVNTFCFGLLFAVIINPNKNNKLNNLLFVLAISIYAFIIYIYWHNPSMAVIGLLGIILGRFVFSTLVKNTKSLVIISLSTMVLNLFIFAFFDGVQLRGYLNNRPGPPFGTDMASYLSTYYQLKEDNSFYQSFAFDIKNRLDNNYPGELWGWKQPITFYLWRIVPGRGGSIQLLATVFFSINLISFYLIGKKFLKSNLALLCPFLVLPYFHYPLTEQTLIQVEWWALSLFLTGAVFYLYNRRLLSGIFFALALASRELFAIPIVFLFIAELFKKDKKWPQNAAVLALPTLLLFFPYYILIHLNNVLRFEKLDTILENSQRAQYQSSWALVRTTLAYNAWSYLLGQLRPFLLLLIFNSLALLGKLFWEKKKLLTFALLSLFLPFFLASFKIGIIDAWHDYWGIYYIPLMMGVTPIAWQYAIEKLIN